jgi:hypothetical protein
MSYYLREIKRTFVDEILLEIEDDPYLDTLKDPPEVGKSHEGLALAHSYKTLTGTVWRKGDGISLSGGQLEPRHLGECKKITKEEAQKILLESGKEVEHKPLKSFAKKAKD